MFKPALLLAAAALTVACSTPPPPPPAPQTPAPDAGSPPAAAHPDQSRGSAQAGSSGTPKAAYGAPTPRGAEVQVEETVHGAAPRVTVPIIAAPIAPETPGVDTVTARVPDRPVNTRPGVVHGEETTGGGGEVPAVAPRPDAPHRDSQTVPPPMPPTAVNGDLRGPAVAGALASMRQTVDPTAVLARARAAAAPAGRGTAMDKSDATAQAGGEKRADESDADAAAGTFGGSNQAPSPGAVAARADDAVARQLAALIEREQDPVLREKLRQEYRRYTAGP